MYHNETVCVCHLPVFLQGTPEFVAVSQCVYYFEWRTYTACKNDKFKPQKEVCGGASGRWWGEGFMWLLRCDE